MIASEHMRRMSDARHKLAFGLPHHMCGVQVQQTCIDNKMYWFAAGQFLIVFFD